MLIVIVRRKKEKSLERATEEHTDVISLLSFFTQLNTQKCAKRKRSGYNIFKKNYPNELTYKTETDS